MSRIALTRLLVANDRSARRRLAGIVAGVMVGVALFLTLLAAAQAFPERSLRSSWNATALLPDSQQPTHQNLQPDHVLADNELAVASSLDTVGEETIRVLQVALPESGTTSVRIPGSDLVPKPGEYLASPALPSASPLCPPTSSASATARRWAPSPPTPSRGRTRWWPSSGRT